MVGQAWVGLAGLGAEVDHAVVALDAAVAGGLLAGGRDLVLLASQVSLCLMTFLSWIIEKI